MLLVFGITMTARLLASPVGGCQRCGNRSRHEVLETARRFSFFFIPLFRVGAPSYVDVCGVCGLETPLTEAQARSVPSEASAPFQTPQPAPSTPQDAPPWTPQDRR